MPGLIDAGNAPVQCGLRALCGGRFAPAGAGAGLGCDCGAGPGGTVAQGAGELRRSHGRGHRPCHIATLTPGQPGAKAPGQRPSRPLAGASRPPGRALAWVALGGMVLLWASCRGGGNAVRFLIPPGEEAKGHISEPPAPSCWQGPSPLPHRHVAPRPAGGQSPRPAPVPPLAGASHPPGRALASVVPGPADLRGIAAHGRGNAVRFLLPPAQAIELPPTAETEAVAFGTSPRQGKVQQKRQPQPAVDAP
jgi:hypothetical protein